MGKRAKTKKTRTPKAPATKKLSSPPTVSETEARPICIECAKHPSLKRFVKKYGTTGHRCGICRRSDLVSSAPAEYAALSSLVRALIRFRYDEWTYNQHWGGDEGPPAMLCSENPIVEHVAAPGFPREAEESEIFLMGLFDPPHPDYDKGIAVYAGNDERLGRLPPLDAIGTSTSPLYENIAKRLATENYFEVENDFRKRWLSLRTESTHSCRKMRSCSGHESASRSASCAFREAGQLRRFFSRTSVVSQRYVNKINLLSELG